MRARTTNANAARSTPQDLAVSSRRDDGNGGRPRHQLRQRCCTWPTLCQHLVSFPLFLMSQASACLGQAPHMHAVRSLAIYEDDKIDARVNFWFGNKQPRVLPGILAMGIE